MAKRKRKRKAAAAPKRRRKAAAPKKRRRRKAPAAAAPKRRRRRKASSGTAAPKKRRRRRKAASSTAAPKRRRRSAGRRRAAPKRRRAAKRRHTTTTTTTTRTTRKSNPDHGAIYYVLTAVAGLGAGVATDFGVDATSLDNTTANGIKVAVGVVGGGVLALLGQYSAAGGLAAATLPVGIYNLATKSGPAAGADKTKLLQSFSRGAVASRLVSAQMRGLDQIGDLAAVELELSAVMPGELDAVRLDRDGYSAVGLRDDEDLGAVSVADEDEDEDDDEDEYGEVADDD